MHIIRSQGASAGAQAVQSAQGSTLRVSTSGRTGVDTAKVDRARAAIAAGSYTVGADLIASRMLADATACAAIGLPLAAPAASAATR